MTNFESAKDFLLRRGVPPTHSLLDFTLDKATGCWIAGCRGSNGYAQYTSLKGRKGSLYRLMYEVVNEVEVPGRISGLELDHICDNGPGGCINPDHLQLVPKRVNILRSSNPCAEKARQTHCKHGHEFTSQNTRVVQRSNGYYSRFCLTCAAESARRFKERHSADEVNAKRRAHYARKREEILAVKRERLRRKKLGLPTGRGAYEDIKKETG